MTQENEIDAMLGGMDSEESGAMEDLEQMAPEMEMIDQLVTMVVQMIQQGASEEEVMMFLREQGLDDEDIGTVLQLVAEMAEAEAMPQDGIGAELEQLAQQWESFLKVPQGLQDQLNTKEDLQNQKILLQKIGQYQKKLK